MSPMTVWKSPPSALHSLSIAVSIFSCVRATCPLSTVSPGAPALRKRGNQRKARRGGWRWWVGGGGGGSVGRAHSRAAGFPRLRGTRTRTRAAAGPAVSSRSRQTEDMSAGGDACRRGQETAGNGGELLHWLRLSGTRREIRGRASARPRPPPTGTFS